MFTLSSRRSIVLALGALSASAGAFAANVDVQVNLGAPVVVQPRPVIVQPRPVVVQPARVVVVQQPVVVQADDCKKGKCKKDKHKHKNHGNKH